jgi:hypothetical protein
MLLKLTTRFFFLLLFFGHTLRLNAQDYRPATLFFQSGKQETGTVQFAKWSSTPQSFRFKKQDGTEQIFNRSQLKSIEFTRLDGLTERYVLAAVQINRSPTALSGLDADPAPRLELDTVFLQELIQSDISFYKLQERNQVHLFIGSDSIRPLIYKRFFKDDGLTNTYKENNRFRQQLLALTSDCPQLQQQILKLSFSEKRIQTLLNRFLTCKNASNYYNFKDEHFSKQVYVAAGAQLPTVSFFTYDNRISDYIKIPTKDHVQPTLAAGLILPLPFSRGAFWFVNEIGVRKISSQVSGDFSAKYYPYYIYKYYADVQVLHLRLQTMFRWYVLRKTRLYVQFGVNNGIKIQNNSTQTTINSISDITEPLKVRSYEPGIVGGLGILYKRFGLDFRYDHNYGLAPNARIRLTGSPVSTFGLTLSYRLR